MGREKGEEQAVTSITLAKWVRCNSVSWSLSVRVNGNPTLFKNTRVAADKRFIYYIISS